MKTKVRKCMGRWHIYRLVSGPFPYWSSDGPGYKTKEEAERAKKAMKK